MLQMLGSTRPFTMQVFKINVEKTVQAIAVLLTAVGHRRLEYLSIIKQLYFADRESWGETGAPITGDVPVAMKNGPVLSGVYCKKFLPGTKITTGATSSGFPMRFRNGNGITQTRQDAR